MPISRLCKCWSLPFEDFELVKTALTHSSFVRENSLSLSFCNERLEFLGDAVLKISISKFLYNKFPNAQEGELTKLRAEIVSDKTLFKLAQKIGLGEYLILGAREEKMGGRKKPSLLACALEAFLGAIFLEFGLERATSFFLDNFTEELNNIERDIALVNPKALLQEYTQAQDRSLPIYETISESGEAHKKLFKVGVYYNDKFLAEGEGFSKKEAQQVCAKNALDVLGVLKEQEK